MTKVYWIHLPEHHLSEGYIGISENVERRFQQHKGEDRKSSNPHLKSAFEKYGDRVKMVVLFEGERKDCLKVEKELRPEKGMGWNVIEGGGDPPKVDWTGKTHNPEAIEKIKKSKKGTKWKEDQREKFTASHSGEKHHMFGKEHSDEARWKMSETRSKKNLKWITNGIENKSIQGDEALPEGWNFGRTLKKRTPEEKATQSERIKQWWAKRKATS